MMNEKQMIDSILYMLNEYDNMSDFLECENMDKMEFEELHDNGFYSEITCGTYNGVTDTFTPYQLTNENIISTLYTMMNEFEFWEFVNDIVENEAINNNWHDLQYINELVHFYDIIIIKDERKIYIDMN